jgi:hypothetical protein
MQQLPPSGSAKNGRKSGKLNLQARKPPSAEPLSGSKMFSTGPHATLEEAAAEASKRVERGARIVGDVRRALLFALVLVVVGVILVEFVKML